MNEKNVTKLTIFLILLSISSILWVIALPVNTSSLELLDRYPWGSKYRVTEAKSVSANEDYMFIAAGNSGIVIINTTDPKNLKDPYIHTIDNVAIDLEINSDLIYILCEDGTLMIQNISNPLDPISISSRKIIESQSPSDYISKIIVKDNLAYVGSYYQSLTIINISNPVNPQILASKGTTGRPYDFIISDNLIYMAVGDSGLAILDCNDPTNISDPIYISLQGRVVGITKEGNYAYSVTRNVNSGLCTYVILDVSNPYVPGVPVYHELNHEPYSIAVRSNIAFIGTYNGLKVVNVSNPLEPTDAVEELTHNRNRISDIYLQDEWAFLTSSMGYSLTIANIPEYLDYYKADLQLRVFFHNTESLLIPIVFLTIMLLFTVGAVKFKESIGFGTIFSKIYYRFSPEFWERTDKEILVFSLYCFICLIYYLIISNIPIFFLSPIQPLFSIPLLLILVLFLSIFFCLTIFEIIKKRTFSLILLVVISSYLLFNWFPSIQYYSEHFNAVPRSSLLAALFNPEMGQNWQNLTMNANKFVYFTLIALLITFVIIGGRLNQKVIHQKHTTRFLRSQEAGFLAIRQMLEREEPNSVLSLFEISTGSKISLGETRWLLEYFNQYYEGNWDSKLETFRIDDDTIEQLDFLTDDISFQLDGERGQKIVQRMLAQLRKAALPISSVQERLDASSDEEVFKILRDQVMSQTEFVTLIDEHYITIKKAQYFCHLCQEDHNDIPYWQCLTCLRYVCTRDFQDLKSAGMELPTCTECGGMMIILPTECQGCYTIFLKVNQWKEKKRCPFCKKEIIVGTGELLSQFMDRYSSKSQAIFSPEEKDRE